MHMYFNIIDTILTIMQCMMLERISQHHQNDTYPQSNRMFVHLLQFYLAGQYTILHIKYTMVILEIIYTCSLPNSNNASNSQQS